jgi:hypothetical protein
VKSPKTKFSNYEGTAEVGTNCAAGELLEQVRQSDSDLADEAAAYVQRIESLAKNKRTRHVPS